MKVFEWENISVTRPTLENISVPQPTLENISVTRPTLENISVTPPTFPISPSKYQFTISPSKMKKGTYHITRTQTHHCHTCHQRKINAMRRKSVIKTGKMTRQTHLRATILTCPMTVVTGSSDIKIRAIGKMIQIC